MNEALFDLLVPFKEAWSNSIVTSPSAFANQKIFERSFSTLLFCKELSVATKPYAPTGQSLLQYPTVRNCWTLRVLLSPHALSPMDIVDWLHCERATSGSKTLGIDCDALLGTVKELMEMLKEVCLIFTQGSRESTNTPGVFDTVSKLFLRRRCSRVLEICK